MITAFLTFVFFFAIVGCVLYGRKLIKTEKVDAVFGNPERAKGGVHWVIVGSSFLLLIWLYYSWDIAKSFFPKSANELCQVGKVNESLLSLKYLSLSIEIISSNLFLKYFHSEFIQRIDESNIS